MFDIEIGFGTPKSC